MGSATCAEGDATQRFTITAAADGEGAFQISNNSAFLQHSARSGLILEELGDADPGGRLPVQRQR
ncbi:hypothetical protein ACN28G_12550 [Micromonospora sp. WMMA1923]|uniref:hypothetical protein n=1 Tax=Micromonospora sp. WMMA1923 TaxID=3404125 RepID=UPI003B93B2A8